VLCLQAIDGKGRQRESGMLDVV